MNKTNPLIHVVFGFNVAIGFATDNWYAGLAFAIAWMFALCFDIYIGNFRTEKKMLELFVQAHKGKWPSKEAEDAAVKELHEFVKNGK